METHHAHHERPLTGSARVTELHAEVTRDRHPHGEKAMLLCDCFRAVSEVAAAADTEDADTESPRIAVTRAKWIEAVRKFQHQHAQ